MKYIRYRIKNMKYINHSKQKEVKTQADTNNRKRSSAVGNLFDS